MTYSSEVKKELSQLRIMSKIEALLELSAIARVSASVVMRGGEIQLRFFSESVDVMHRVINIIRYLYRRELPMICQKNESLQIEPIYSTLLDSEELDRFIEQSGFDLLGDYREEKTRILSRLRSEVNSKAYVRGAFLGGGSIVDPHKSYHFEIVTTKKSDMEILKEVFDSMDLKAKCTKRKNHNVIYFKDSEAIADCLVCMGATNAMLALEDVKAYKEIRNDANRRTNADAANISKQVKAATKQIQNVEYLKKVGKFSELPDALKEIAELRLSNPILNYRELGEIAKPKISKSGVNHRMNRLMKFAEEIKSINNK